MADSSHIQLPLNGLLDRLKQEGFQIGADTYVLIHDLLMDLGGDWQDQGSIETLRNSLSILLAKSEDEQKRFHVLFDQYYPSLERRKEEAKITAVVNKQERWKKWKERLNSGGIFVLVSFILIVCAYFFVKMRSVPQPQFSVSSCTRVGDYLQFHNLTEVDGMNTDAISFCWDFGDGKGKDSTNWNPKYRYEEAGVYTVSLSFWGQDSLTTSQTIQVDDALEGRIEYSPIILTEGDTVEFSYRSDKESFGRELICNWYIDSEIKCSNSSRCTHVFTEARTYSIGLMIHYLGDCDSVLLETQIQNEDKIAPLAEYPLKKEETLETLWSRKALWYYWGGGLLMCLILAVVAQYGLHKWSTTPSRRTQLDLDKAIPSGEEGPLWFSFPNKRQAIVRDSLLDSLAVSMRLQLDSDRLRLDVQRSLFSTIRNGGIPKIHLKAYSKSVSYLALIEVSGGHDQRGVLFRYWLDTLADEGDVEIIEYFYKDDPRFLEDVNTGETVELKDLAQLFPDHHLLVLGKGEGMIRGAKVQPWLSKAFEAWEQKMLLTPVDRKYWSYQELLLEQVFHIFPLDVEGQRSMLENNFQNLGVREWKKEDHSLYKNLGRVDWYSYKGLQKYFSAIGLPGLERWVAAMVIYPQPDLNVCLIVGEVLEQRCSYEHLYAITRIPWMQNKSLPSATRTKLISKLDAKEEKKVRDALGKTLHGIGEELKKVYPNSMALRELSVQQHIQAFEYPRRKSAELNYLADQGMLPMSVAKGLSKRMRCYLYLFSFLCLLSVLALCNVFANTNLLGIGREKYPVLYTEENRVDSSTLALNHFVDAMQLGDLDSAKNWIDNALELDSTNHQAKLYEAMWLYEMGLQAYEQGEYEGAIQYFQLAKTDDSFEMFRLHALGLAYFYSGDKEKADSCRIVIENTYPNFLSIWKQTPNLFTLLFTFDEIDVLLKLAREALEKRDYETAVHIYQVVLAMDQENEEAKEGIEEYEKYLDLSEDIYSPSEIKKADREVGKPSIMSFVRIHSKVGSTYLKQDSVKEQKPVAIVVPLRRSKVSILVNPSPRLLSPVLESKMVKVVGGEFVFGCQSTNWHCWKDEIPTREAEIRDFWIGRKEVTYNEWDAFCQATGRDLPSDNGWGRGELPVTNVSWYDAIEYCNWLSAKNSLEKCYTIDRSIKDPNNKGVLDGKKWAVSCDFNANGYRLPTEAEWEYAAKGGKNWSAMEYTCTNSPDSLPLYGNRRGDIDGYQVTAPVGSFLPNQLGIYDLCGNVAEWCWDWKAYYIELDTDNPKGSESGTQRIVRGGSWKHFPHQLQVTFRGSRSPTTRNATTGFRVLRKH